MAFKFYTLTNLFKQQVPENRKDSYDDITVWETDTRKGYNDFPQQLIQDAQDSPTGATALEVWEEFTAGNGFVSEELNQIKVNDDETLQELSDKLAGDLVRFYGFAIHVSYNAKGEITKLHHQPFEQTRLGSISKNGRVNAIKTNPYFGIRQDYDSKYTKTYYTYNPDPQHVRDEIVKHRNETKGKQKYPGQIFWVSIEKPLARVYPIPFYYSGINWFRIDSEIQKYHERNLKNNLLQSHIINVYGNPDAPAGPEDDNGDQKSTVGEQFQRDLENKAQGAKLAGGQWVNWFTEEEQKLTIEAFPTNINDNTFVNLQDQTNSQISIATGVPPILLSIQMEGKLGESREIINAIKMMQGKVKRLQTFLSKNLKKVMLSKDTKLAEMDFEIRDHNLINVLPEWAIEVMNENEKRKYLQDNFPVELSIAEELTTPTDGGDQSIQGISGRHLQQIQMIIRRYNKEQLTRDQAAQLLRSNFGIREEDIPAWLGEEAEPEQNDVN